MSERIKSLSWSGPTIEIKGVETFESGAEREWLLKSSEPPAPSLAEKLHALAPLVRTMLGLPDDWAAGKFTAYKVSWSFSESTEVKGATITLRADLECATTPIVINTPHLPFEVYGESTQKTMPAELVVALDEVEAEAWDYLSGKRAQGDLFEHEPTGRFSGFGDAIVRPDAAVPASPIEAATEAVVKAVSDIVDEALESDKPKRKGRKAKGHDAGEARP